MQVTKLPTTLFVFLRVPLTHLGRWFAFTIKIPRDFHRHRSKRMGYHFAVWAASILRTVVSLCCVYQILIHFSPWRFTCHGKLILWQFAHDSAMLDFLNLWKRKHMLKHRNIHSRHSVWVNDSFIAWKVNNNFNFYYMVESASGQDGAKPAFWLATWVGKMGPARYFPRWTFEEI